VVRGRERCRSGEALRPRVGTPLCCSSQMSRQCAGTAASHLAPGHTGKLCRHHHHHHQFITFTHSQSLSASHTGTGSVIFINKNENC